MSATQKKLTKGEIIFREGDPSDACYVVKSGKIVITKAKGNSEIELASLGPGAMFGEMAFFDGKPRSATAKAAGDALVISLPFASLNAQFASFPQWLKVMVNTINDHLRDANKRIKNLEQSGKGEDRTFPPHTITRLCAILSLVGHRYGEKTSEGVIVPTGLLRNYTIQVFGEPTHKMQKLMDILQGLGILKIEDLGEGRQKLTVFKLELLSNFVDFYNTWLFTEEAKRIKIEQTEVRLLKALCFYGSKSQPDDKGKTKISLTAIQNDSMKDTGSLIQLNNWNSLIEKGLLSEKTSEPDGQQATTFDLKEIERILPYWEIVYGIEVNDRQAA